MIFVGVGRHGLAMVWLNFYPRHCQDSNTPRLKGHCQDSNTHEGNINRASAAEKATAIVESVYYYTENPGNRDLHDTFPCREAVLSS